MKNRSALLFWIAVMMVLWLCIYLPLRYYNPLQLRVRHTFQLPSNACTGTLTSDFTAWNTVREGLFELYVIVPFATILMAYTSERVGWRANVLTLFLAMAWANFSTKDVTT